MPGTTTNFSWPYPTGTDSPPNVASDMQSLASAIDTSVGAAWITTHVPTLTNLTLGNGTMTFRYFKYGNTFGYKFKFKLGTTSAVGTAPRFTLPFAPAASYVANEDYMGIGQLVDSGSAARQGYALLVSGSTLEIFHFSSTGVQTTITATVPWTWATSDSLQVNGLIELA